MKKYCACGSKVCQQHFKKHWLKYSVVIVALLLLDSYTCNFFIDKGEITLVNVVSFLIAVVGLVFFYKRVKNQDKQIDIQIKQRVDERFTTAVNLLASSETSARTGAIYSLSHLALDEKKYRQEIAQILCSHMRSKTEEKGEKGYQKVYNKRPSNEIQTTINLLFKAGGLYHKFNEELAQADLSYAFLVGADFERAKCQGVNFSHAECQGVNFSDAECQGAYFSHAKCQGARFFSAKCQGVNFSDAECQRAYFSYAECQKASFQYAKCQGTSFSETQCQEAYFLGAECQEANFSHAKCQRVNFERAKCQGVNFNNAQCQGAHFFNAECQGVNFSDAKCQGVNFGHAKCQGANFEYAECQEANFQYAECQGANFSYAQCQGAHFKNTECQGAYTYAEDITIPLVERIAKDTALDNVVFAGVLDEAAIESIESAKDYLGDKWYQEMQKIIKENAGKAISNTLPEGIITGVLEDSAQMQAIIAKDWQKLK